VGGPKGTTRTFLRQGDAKTYLADLESRRRLGSLYREQPVLFGEEAEGWRERQKVGIATRKLYRAACNTLSPLDSLYVNQVTVRVADDLISKKARTASASARLALTVLKRILRSAQERGQSIDEGVLRMKLPRHTVKAPRFLTMEEVELLASHMPEHLHRAVIFAAWTGVRGGELVALADEHLFLDRAAMFVPGTKTPASAAEVDLLPEAVALIREQLLARPHGARHLFPSTEGEGMTAEQLRAAFRVAVAEAGLEGVVFHHLRHTFAGLLVQANVHSHVAASLMRHGDGGALFSRRYAKHRRDDERAALAAVSALLRKDEEGRVSADA
jgi:integrase